MSDEKLKEALQALEEDRWLSPVSIDIIHKAIAAKDAEIAELKDDRKFVSADEYDRERAIGYRRQIRELRQQLAAVRAERDAWRDKADTYAVEMTLARAERDLLRSRIESAEKVWLVWQTFPSGCEDVVDASRHFDDLSESKTVRGNRVVLVHAVPVAEGPKVCEASHGSSSEGLECEFCGDPAKAHGPIYLCDKCGPKEDHGKQD